MEDSFAPVEWAIVKEVEEFTEFLHLFLTLWISSSQLAYELIVVLYLYYERCKFKIEHQHVFLSLYELQHLLIRINRIVF